MQESMASSIFFFFLCVSSFLLFPISDANEDTGSSTTSSPVPSGTIQRELMQQILATIPPNSNGVATAPFLTSPSGKYTGYLVRRTTVPEAGGLGSDFCLIQIQDAVTGASVWDSECAPVSSANPCDLVLCDSGLAVLDGSRSAWDNAGGTNTNNSFAASMELEDQGDLQLVDEDGASVWKASDDPRVDQGCGLPASPGQQSGGAPPALPLPPASAPFAAPVGGDDSSGETDLPLSPAPPPSDPGNSPSGETDPPLSPAPPPSDPGNSPSGETDPPLSPAPPPSYPGNSPSGETDPPLSPAPPPFAGTVAGEAPPSYPSNSPSGETDPPLSPATPPFAGTVAGDAPPPYPSNSPSGETDPPLSPAPPPFAGTLAGDVPPSYPSNSIGGLGQQQQQQLGFGGQHPLADNTLYDSGSSRKVASIGVLLAMAGCLLV